MSATPPHWLAVPPPTPELAEEPPTSNVTTNAADIYRHAFAAYDALTDEEKKLLGDWKTPMDPLVAAALCQKLQLMREWLHQAASVTNCDWGLGPITPETPLPHLLAARALARAMVWSAAHCRVHDPTGTTADLWATLRLGQQVSSPGLIGHLVQTAMEGMVLDYIAANVGALRGGPAAQLLQALGDPQYEESYYRAMEDEAKIIRRLADQVAALSPEEAQAYLRSMLVGGQNARGQEWAQAVAGCGWRPTGSRIIRGRCSCRRRNIRTGLPSGARCGKKILSWAWSRRRWTGSWIERARPWSNARWSWPGWRWCRTDRVH